MENNRERVILISFFKSENIGDKKLSKELLRLVEKKFKVKYTYDFSSLKKVVDDNNRSDSDNMNVYSLKKNLKKVFLLLLGKKNYKRIIYHRVAKKNMLRELFEDIKYSQRVIIGGGNMLMDRDKTWPLRMEKIINHCHNNDIKVDIIYVGAGPIFSPLTKRIYKKIFAKIETLMVRDYRSKNKLIPYVESKKIDVGYDPALTYNQLRYEERFNGIKKSTKINLGINIIGEECFSSKRANDKYIKNMYELINFLSEDSVEKIILFSTAKKDYKNINKLITMINNPKVTIWEINNHDNIVELYSTLSFLVGGRMHSLIFAQSAFLPYLALAWDDKVYGYLDMIDNDFKAIGIENITEHFNYIKSYILNHSNNVLVIEKMNSRNLQINESRENINI